MVTHKLQLQAAAIRTRTTKITSLTETAEEVEEIVTTVMEETEVVDEEEEETGLEQTDGTTTLGTTVETEATRPKTKLERLV